MKSRFRLIFLLLFVLAIGLGASRLFSRESSALAAQKVPTAPAQQSSVDRGRYLVENVAMCEECHTPRDASGALDESRRLQGAPIWIVPVRPNPNWAMNAPALAGFSGYTDEQGAQVLEQGVGPNGLAIRQPMHIYRMNHADALAIMAYLRSLPGTYPQQ
jgi:mono/diheme cytochrome c family protein